MPAVSSKPVYEFINSVSAARFIRFLGVGGTAACIYVVLATVFVELLDWQPVVASGVAYGICMPVAYLAQKVFTFSSLSPHRAAFPRYIALQLVSLVLASVIAEVASQVSRAPPISSFLFAAVAAIIFNYVFMNCWVFLRR